MAPSVLELWPTGLKHVIPTVLLFPRIPCLPSPDRFQLPCGQGLVSSPSTSPNPITRKGLVTLIHPMMITFVQKYYQTTAF